MFNHFNVNFSPEQPGNLVLWIDSTVRVEGTLDSSIDSVGDLSRNEFTCIGTAPNRPLWLSNELKNNSAPSIYFPDYEADWLDISGPDDPLLTSEYGIVCSNGYSVFSTFKTLGTDVTSTYEGNPPMPIIGNYLSWVYNAFGLNGGQVEYRNYFAAWSTTVSSGLSLNDGNIHTVAVCHRLDGSVTLYADGIPVTVATGVGYEVLYTGCASIGYSYSADQAQDMHIGELMVWNGPISDTHVRLLHQRAKNLWRF